MSEATDGLAQFATEMQQSILTRIEREGEEEFPENAFTEYVLQLLADAGETEDASLCPHQAGTAAQSLKVSAWALSGGEDLDECLDLFVSVYSGEKPPRTISKDEMGVAFNKLKRFAAKAFQGYHYTIEESSRVFDACQRIDEVTERISRIRFILLTDGIVKAAPPPGSDTHAELNGRTLSYRPTYHVWDLERLFRLYSSGREQEPIEIDFLEATGGPVPCLAQPNSSNEYAAYLAIFPATVLAALYGEYGSRLLERNVRSFLQARGQINAGIRNTIRKQPQRFLAYNNGLSMTAVEVETVQLASGGLGLKRVKDLQIVNGGQTTASIFHAQKKDRADLSELYVQAKLTVIADPAIVDEIVPLISKYANSQNKVQTADFAANDALHREIERLSRTIWAPALKGSQRQTHWFYERARGQYQDDIARNGTPARIRDFKEINPTSQLFSKTDMAKFAVTWDQRPHVVSRGAQFCFNDFRVRLEEHLKFEGPLNEDYFKRLIAKAILFRHSEHIMKRLGYAGYRANLVTYTLARLSKDSGGRIDLMRIWKDQCLSPALANAVEAYSKHTWEHITRPPGAGNVTQYCKTFACWETFEERAIPFPGELQSELTPVGGSKSSAAVDKRPEAVKMAMQITSEAWFSLAEWGKRNDTLNGLQLEIVCKIASDIGYSVAISPKQATLGMAILKDARKLGFRN